MKPTYTVRLTGDLEPDERQRIAARVAGVTEIEADKIERLLERGAGRDLIKPSSASVANRLASVLAEAGAPVRLTPIVEPEPAPPEAAELDRGAPSATDDDVLRPRQSAPVPEAPPVSRADPVASPTEPAKHPAEPAGEPEMEPTERHAPSSPPVEAEPGAGDRPAASRPSVAADAATPPSAPEAEPALPDPESEERAAFQEAPEPPPEPEVTVTPQGDPGVRARPADPAREPPPPKTVEPPARAPRANGGAALLGAVGAAILGIGAVFAMDLMVGPIAIGVLVLAVLALGLSLLGQRRATWLPGLGALALIVWAIANAVGGPMATLAANWQWYAMFAGSLLVIVAGFQEAQRWRAR